MHLLYLDASGTPELQDVTTNYVLAGVVIHESAWTDVERRFQDLASTWQVSAGLPLEFHAKVLTARIHEQVQIPGFNAMSRQQRRDEVLRLREAALLAIPAGRDRGRLAKEHRHTDPLVHLTFVERFQLLAEALDLIASLTSLTLLSYAIDKRFFFRIRGQADNAEEAFMQVVSRFDYLAQRSNRQTGRFERGLLVLDEEGSREPHLRKLLAKFRSTGHPYGALRTVIEAPFFVESAVSIGVQIADLVSYAVRRYVEHQDKPREIANLRRIWDRFDKEGGTIHGLRHYCAHTCECVICAETKRDE